MLFASLYTTATGVQAANNLLDLTSNNVANASTPGYKTAQATFQDLLYNSLSDGSQVGNQVGAGTRLDGTAGLFTQGTLSPTGGQFDLAVTGDGFFRVTRPDGTTAYTRSGSFSLNSAGQLVTAAGDIVSPPITVPSGTTSVTIGTDGTVTAVTPTGTQTVGQIGLTRFVNPSGLERVGDTLFAATPASGAPQDGTPGTTGLGTITQGSLENSNVDLPTELVNLVIAQAAATFNSQALVVENTLLAETSQLTPDSPAVGT